MDDPAHRHSPRHLICIPILFARQGEKSYSLDYTTDLSEGGVLIQTSRPLPAGTTVSLKFRLPSSIKLIQLTGEVVWSHSYIPGQSSLDLLPGMGVKFNDLDETSRAYITMFVTAERERQGADSSLLQDLDTNA